MARRASDVQGKRATTRAAASAGLRASVADLGRDLRARAAAVALAPSEIPVPPPAMGQAVYIDTSLSKALAEVIRQITERIAEIMATNIEPWVKDIADRYPVDSGEALRGITVETPPVGGALRVVIRGSAKHTYMARWGKQNPDTPEGLAGTSAWASLVSSQRRKIETVIASVITSESRR